MRASTFVLALALALVGIGGERVAAAACDPTYKTGLLCQNPTPVCPLLTETCTKCTNNTLGTLVLGNDCPISGQTCEANGACITSCTGSYVDGGVDGGCPAALPYCNTGTTGTCSQCAAGTPQDPFCPPTAPSCNSNAVCGCTGDGDCSATPGATCQVGGGVYAAGMCVVTCSADTGCTTGSARRCAVDGGPDTNGSPGGRCVECFADSDCDAGQVCNTTADSCIAGPPDAGTAPSSDGGTDGGSNGDGGGAIADSGAHDGGGSSSRDATVPDGGEEETTETYPPGKLEGGGCSLLTLGAGGGSDSPVPPALVGFAGLAGLFFLRRSQRRSSKGRDERR